MTDYFQSSLKSITARMLRAVCISSLVALHGLVAIGDASAQNKKTSKPIATYILGYRVTQPPAAKPLWHDLTTTQQQILAPLATDWDKLNAVRKKKWLVLTDKFPSMKPAEQKRIQERMHDWAKLTPAQRRAVRESYVRSQKMNRDQKSEKWQQYQNLSEDQKKKLADKTKAKKRVTNLPSTTSNKNKPRSKSTTKTLLDKPATTPSTAPALPQNPEQITTN